MSSNTTTVPGSLSLSSDSPQSSSNDLTVSPRCYIKMIMHALRYPHATINGILIMEKKSKSSKTNRFVDCIPLFHSGHGLTPMVEVALTQVSEYLNKNTNLVIGGYYQANEYFHEFPHPTPTVFAERIAEKIYENNSDSVLLMISNYDLATAIDAADSLNLPFYLYNYVDGKWKLKGNTTNSRGVQLENSSLTFDALQELIFSKQYHLNLIDFDSHLENVQYDWRNPKLNEMIDKFAKI